MTALAYLQEAAVAGRLTVNDVAEVRVFVERLLTRRAAFSPVALVAQSSVYLLKPD